MNKNQKIILITIVLISLGLFVYFFMTGNKNTYPSMQPVTTNDMQNPKMADESLGEKFKGTLSDLVKKGQNYTCNYTTTDKEGNTTNGSLFIAAGGKNMFSSFEYKAKDGTSYTGNLIKDNSYNYVWTSDQAQGFKTPVTEEEEMALTANPKNEKANETVDDSETEIDFDCKPWIVDTSKFTPPSNIEFVDMTETMKQMQEMSKQAPEADCSMCSSLPAGEAQTQCKKSLGC